MASLKELALDQQQALSKSAAAEVAAAFSRAFDVEVTAEAVPGKNLKVSELSEGFSGPGLAIVLPVGELGMLVLVTEASNLLPSWYAAPDPTGESKLKTLAQELGMLLLPDSLMPDDFSAGRVRQMLGALGRAGVSDETWQSGLDLTAADGRRGTAWIIWPVAHPGAVIGAGAARPKPKPQPAPAKKPAPRSAGPVGISPGSSVPPPRTVTSLRDLPDYTRSLLRIRVPVVVTLANNRQPLGRIVELGPGSIIHFDKSCEEMLDLEVGGHSVARGEAVKVGDKFGLRITSITLPEERFKPIPPRRR